MRYIFTVSIVIFCCTLFYCRKAENITVIKLDKGWTFNEEGKNAVLPAVVPGSVHTDLLDNKIIPDPYFGVNEKKLQWIGERNWVYQTSFILSDEILKKKHINLFFKGLDTYADVYLNDELILKADNMFREWNVDCKQKAKKENKIIIVFNNVFSTNLPKWVNAPFRLQAFPNNDQADTMLAIYSRKAQFHYGWDWGPRLITCGIWKDVVLEAWDDVKLCNVQVVQNNVSQQKADIVSNLEILSDTIQNASIDLKINDKDVLQKQVNLTKGRNLVRLDYLLNNPKLWWTNGLGEQFLYKFEYSVKTKNNSSDLKSYSIGIRSIELVREKDSIGTSFYFKLNGIPVFMKGANYIPQDNFQNRITRNDYEYMIKSANEANMNMLRVWGGGVFQDNAFYEMCDKYGILVWHDMMFACGMYPSTDEFYESVKSEILDNITRIRNHPSLAVYCGNNENFISWYNWGWKQKFSEDVQIKYEQDLNKLYLEVIPQALHQTDSTRQYSFSSPSAGFNNIPYGQGDIHYWGVWHGQEPFENYEKNIARFVSEYGFQSYPEINTVEKYTTPADREVHSEVMLTHQRCMADDRKDKEYGNRLIKTYMDRYYNTPKDFENYLYVSQVLHAEGGSIAVEAHRKNKPKCMGSLYWQIDDCWPVASWSSIDYYGNWKALHYYARRFFSQVLIIPALKENKVDVTISSDELADIEAVLETKCFDFRGKELSKNKRSIKLLKNTSNLYCSFDAGELLNGGEKENSFVEFTLSSKWKTISSKIFYFVLPKNLKLNKPSQLEVNITSNGEQAEVEIKSDALLKDVWVSLKGESAKYSDNYFDLLPGEAKKITITPKNKIPDFREKLKIISLCDSY